MQYLDSLQCLYELHLKAPILLRLSSQSLDAKSVQAGFYYKTNKYLAYELSEFNPPILATFHPPTHPCVCQHILQSGLPAQFAQGPHTSQLFN